MRLASILLVAAALAGCTQAFFQPHGVLVATPKELDLEYERVEFQAEDGTRLFAWFLPAPGKRQGTVLFLHGNAENISTHFANVAWMPSAGFSVLAIDYRGYGASEGTPSLHGVQMDIDAAMRVLLRRRDVDPSRIFLFGQSLGGALAIHYAAHSSLKRHVRAVVADSAFSDYHLITREKLASSPLTWAFQWLPLLTVDNDYSPLASAGALSPIPLLLIHGRQDTIVPPDHSLRLYERAVEPKELWVVPGAGHIEATREKSVRERLVDFLRRHAP